MSPGATRTLAVTPAVSCVTQSLIGTKTCGSATHLPPVRVETKRSQLRAAAALVWVTTLLARVGSGAGDRSTIWMPDVSSIADHTASSIGTSATMLHSCERLRATARAISSSGSSPVPPWLRMPSKSPCPTAAGM